MLMSKRLRQHGRWESRPSAKRTLTRATLLGLLGLLPASSMVMASRTCSSSRPRQRIPNLVSNRSRPRKPTKEADQGSRPRKRNHYGPLPNLLSNNAHNVVQLKGNPTSVAMAHQKHSALFCANNSKPVADAKGAAVDPGQSTVIESATVDSASRRQSKISEASVKAWCRISNWARTPEVPP